MEQLPLPLAATTARQREEPPTPDAQAPPAVPVRNDAATSAEVRDVRRCDPADMALRGRIGAYRLHVTHDPRETTKKARERFMERFEREVDPDGVLPDDERARRAEYARKAYFARLALARNTRNAAHRRHRGAGRSRGDEPTNRIDAGDGGTDRRAA